MLETTPLSEPNKPETAQTHNAKLTGTIETFDAPTSDTFTVPGPYAGVPTIAPETNMTGDTLKHRITDREQEIIPETDINVPNGEQETETPDKEQGTDVGSTRLTIRLETARQAIKLLEDPTLGLNERLKIMATIEKLTVGARGRGKAKEKSKSGLFSK